MLEFYDVLDDTCRSGSRSAFGTCVPLWESWLSGLLRRVKPHSSQNSDEQEHKRYNFDFSEDDEQR